MDDRAGVDFERLDLVEPDAIPLDHLAGFGGDDALDAWAAFLLSCQSIVASEPGIRPGTPPSPALIAICADALRLATPSLDEARAFFAARFEARRIRPSGGAKRGFLTGYYEPIIEGSWTQSAAFSAPLLARPDDLLASRPYASRADIEAAGAARYTPLVWVRDPIEAFMIQVQGSATIRAGGDLVRLTYAGRNGRPYTSIGRILIERGEISPQDMSLARLKQWVREHGQRPGEAGRELLWRNESFVFFAIDASPARALGPIGAAGTPLRPLRSIAVDRTLWPYGTPVWIDANLPWQSREATPFRRLMVAQDTGTAIVGAARVDLYIGAGDAAGEIAGNIRHGADLTVLLPRQNPAGPP